MITLRWILVWKLALIAILLGLFAMIGILLPFLHEASGTYDSEMALTPFFAIMFLNVPAGLLTALSFYISPDRKAQLLKITLAIVAGPPVIIIGAIACRIVFELVMLPFK
ncbi:hypothetical protein [Prosthecobacter sp.]|jgi:hypothetical protein